MASDLSSGCTEVIEILDEREEGEISLEDVSSSEEGQLNEGCNFRRRTAGQCSTCLSTKHCASWCSVPTRKCHSKNTSKQDAGQEKENCHHTKDSSYSDSKHVASKLKENNNDLIPISSDSDMEIVGLADSVKPPIILPTKTTKLRKRRRKKRNQNSSVTVENGTFLTAINATTSESSVGPRKDSQILEDNHLPRIHRRESNSPHKMASSTFARIRVTKSPLRRHRSPFERIRSPVLRKSPTRRPRSPIRRSPPSSPTRSPPKKQLRTSLSPSVPIIDMYGNVSKLLKKVRHLKTVGIHPMNRNTEKRRGHGPSLKDKLNNMMKTTDIDDNLEAGMTSKYIKRKKSTEIPDDEEDLALLRKMALETKPKKHEPAVKKENGVKREIIVADDDVEDLELRMIALKSAMLKKHENRIQRGVVPGKTKRPTLSSRTSTQSPFSQSFLDNIPIPAEDIEEEFKTPPLSPIVIFNENTNPEDMELDSEVELEKEKESEPYSPTDDISQQIAIDSHMVGIQPSNGSFLMQSSQVTLPSNLSTFQVPLGTEEIDILQTGASYLAGNETTDNDHLILSSQSTYHSNSNTCHCSQSPTNSLYSPSNPTEQLENQFSTSNDNLRIAPYSPSQPIDTPEIYLSPQHDPFFNSDPDQIPDTPYSPTDTPIYDVELNNTPLVFNNQHFQESDLMCHKPVDEPSEENCRNKKHQSALINIKLVSNLPNDNEKPFDKHNREMSLLNTELTSSFRPEIMEMMEKDNQSEISSMKADNGSAFNSSVNSPDSTMITVDDLPETDLDGSPLVSLSQEMQDIEIHNPEILTKEITKLAQEPLYLKGVPDVTKDVNKIPTLVNRSLVPASILKSNKKLQQPLPTKKIEIHLEPAFKSAQMQPVQISKETNKAHTLFKPIKLAAVIKKPQLKMITPSAFNCSFNDNPIPEEQRDSNNVNSVFATSTNEAATSFEHSQTDALSKILETTDTPKSYNDTAIAQLVSSLEQLTNSIQDPAKSNDRFASCDKESTESVNEYLDKDTTIQSRRRRSRRSKNTTKMTREDKSSETKDSTANVSKATVNEQTLIHKPNFNSNKIYKSHSVDEFPPRIKSAREKFKKNGTEKSKRDREERGDRRSGHKYDKTSNDHKQTDANEVNDRRVSTKKQQQKIMETEAIEPDLQNTTSLVDRQTNSLSQSNSVDSEIISIKNTTKMTKTAFNSHENVERSVTPVDETKKNNINIPISALSEDSGHVENSDAKDGEDMIEENPTCKKVEASKRRRSSLDDDEEALRAILLASLAKRSKPSNVSSNTKLPTTPLANLSLSPGNTSTESVKDLPDMTGSKVAVNSVYSSSCESTPPSLNENRLTSNTSSDKNFSPGNLSQVTVSDIVIAKNVVSDNANRDQIPPTAGVSRKRSISSATKAPFKKIVKKGPISASAKVVNNAKKYQNTLVQKKLNLQKVAMIANAQKTIIRNNSLGKKVIDGNRPRSMITQPLSDTQRFIINLASDSESESESEIPEKNLNESVNNVRSEQRTVLAIPMSEFERSVDLFLKDVRKKQETAAAIKPASTNVTQKPASPVTFVPKKFPVVSTTPQAVRHLPVSLQEEYRRLKQQILEREKLKLHRVLVNNTSPLSPSSKGSSTPPGPLSPASPISSLTMSKQNHSISTQSPIITTDKESGSRSVIIQSTSKTAAVTIATKIIPVINRPNVPRSSTTSNLSIQIPNETTHHNSNIRRLGNSYIPASDSHARLVTAVKISQATVNTTDSAVSTKDQLNLKNVQIQLQQGKVGRKVSLSEALSLSPKTVINPKTKETEPQGSTVVQSVDSNRVDITVVEGLSLVTNFNKTSVQLGVDEKCDNSVDSAASTLIISREEDNNDDSTLVDSSTSTLIISKNKTPDNCRMESLSSENSELSSQISEPPTTGQRKLKNNTETWEKIRGDVRKELDAISALPPSQQKSYLMTVEQNLVKKRYAILDDLSEISGNLRQLEMEKEVQSNMASEVKKLQEQLQLAEERLQAQRTRVNKMVPNVTAIYEKFNDGRRECVKMTRICLGLGCLVIGRNYKIPAAGAQLLNNRLKQVAGCTRQLSGKKTSSIGKRDVERGTKIDPPIEMSIIEKTLDNPMSESAPSTVQENSEDKGENSTTIGTDTVMDNPQNTDNKLTARVEADKIGIGEQYMLQFETTTMESVSIDSPARTSTPNSSKANSSGTENREDSGTSTPDFVLDSPKAGLSEKMNCSVHQKPLQPYKSVLTHLRVRRTTDPSGILCPYELMGTCRDEECQFLHQSARNGS